MTKKERTAIQTSSKKRRISSAEVDEMARLDRKTSLRGKTIRVYAFEGFVPNSYSWPCPIEYLERVYINDKKIFRVGTCDAKRSHGNGALVTVDGRGYRD